LIVRSSVLSTFSTLRNAAAWTFPIVKLFSNLESIFHEPGLR